MPHIRTYLAAALIFTAVSAHAADSTPAPAYTEPVLSAFELSMVKGRAAVKNKNYPQAVTAFADAVKQEPRNADAHTMLAYSYRVQATPNLPKSFEHYDIALKINPLHKGANEYVGQAHVMDKNLSKAREHLAALEKICGKQCPEYKNLDGAINSNRPNNSYGY